MSTRTSFFILMVGLLPSPFLSRTLLSSPLPPHLFVSLCFPRREILPWLLYPRSQVPLSPPAHLSCRHLLIPVAAVSSSCSCRLDSFLLSRRERLNSLRPLFTPVSRSFPLGLIFLVATSRPQTIEMVTVVVYVSHLYIYLRFNIPKHIHMARNL